MPAPADSQDPVPHASTLQKPAHTPAPSRLRTASAILLCALVGGLGYSGLRMAQAQAPDFEFFYKGGRWLLDHGTLDRGVDVHTDGRVEPRGTIEWYLPAVSRLMTLLAWMPQTVAGVVWLGLNLAALLALARLTAIHFMGAAPREWPPAALAALCALILPWYWEVRLNQINLLTLLLLLASFVHWRQGRSLLSGFWLGWAILLKLTPALLLAWFLLKRQARTCAAAGVTVLLCGPVSDLAVFGPGHTADLYRAWWRAAVIDGSPRGNILAQREMDWRNQSTAAVFSRWLHTTNWSTRFDNDPRLPPDPTPRYSNVADWAPRQVAWLVLTLSITLVAALALVARRPAAALPPARLTAEWALFLLATLWLMPVMRRYHIVWAMPAAAILLAHAWRTDWTRLSARLAAAALAIFLATHLSLLLNDQLGSNILEALGVLWLGTVALGAGLGLLMTTRERESSICAQSSPAPTAGCSNPHAPLRTSREATAY